MSYILFIDSGLGGLTTLAETIKIHKANYLYFADTKYSPYGRKSVSFLQKRLRTIISNLSQKYHISMVVLACNTATTTSIKYLRDRFKNINFVGTEPALKLCLNQNFSHPTILATPQTINHLHTQYFDNIYQLKCNKLAKLIEQYFLYPNIQNKYLLIKNLYNIKSKISHADCLVLGCTHYSIIKKSFIHIFKTPIVDGNQGVANRIASTSTKKTAKTSVKIILSSKKQPELQKYKKILNQILANQINL